MSNLILHTEDFTDAEWVNGGSTLTANAAGPPAAFGIHAGNATKIEDADAATQTNLFSPYYAISPNSAVVVSMFILKDQNSSRWPVFGIQMDGIGRVKGLSFQTSDGSFGTPAGATLPDDYGCISFDHRWWRLWFKMIDIDSSSAARFFVFPAHTTSLDGGTDDGTLTGAFIGWGANLTNSSSLLNYEPAPSYSIDIEQRRFGRRNARRSWVR